MKNTMKDSMNDSMKDSMKAVVNRRYGTADELAVERVPRPRDRRRRGSWLGFMSLRSIRSTGTH